MSDQPSVLTAPGIQARTVRVLVAGQVLLGVSAGAVVAVGSVLAAQISGSDALAGAAATLSTLGSAAASIPLARLALKSGRRPALTVGALIAAVGSLVTLVAISVIAFPVLLVGFGLLGVGTAVGLQARFAATDSASAAHRGRDLSIVVWSTTIGAVVGPNLIGPGAAIADAVGAPHLAGSFVIAIAAQLLAAVTYFVALRPDPLVVARSLPVATVASGAGEIRGRGLLIFAIAALATSHATMVSVMAMTPVHMTGHGTSLTIVGFTISLHIAGMYGLSPLFGWASDRIGRVQTILIGQGLFAVSLVTLGLGSASDSAVAVGLVLLGLGWSAATVAASALIADLVTGAERVRVQGRSDLAMNIAGALGGALAGPVLALVTYPGLAAVVGVLVALVIGASLVVRRRAIVA